MMEKGRTKSQMFRTRTGSDATKPLATGAYLDSPSPESQNELLNHEIEGYVELLEQYDGLIGKRNVFKGTFHK